MKRPVPLIQLLSLLIFLTSCGVKVDGTNNELSSAIGGRAVMLNGVIAQSSFFSFSAWAAPSCDSDVYAKLYALTLQGELGQLMDTKLLGSDAKFVFDASALKNGTDVEYIIEVSGCDEVYYRPVTSLDHQQDVTYASSIIGLITKTSVGQNLTEAKKAHVADLIKDLSGNSLNNAYNALNSNLALSQKFNQTFGSSPAVLTEAAPSVLATTIDLFPLENVPSVFSVSSTHFDPAYDIVVNWKLDGVLKSTASNWSYTPGPNDQGNKALTLYIGKDDGNGNIDTTRPFVSRSYLVTVMNSVLPTPPDLSIAATLVGNRNISIDLDTGLGMANCESFTSLALTQDTNAVPGNAAFNITCSTAVSQAISVALTGAGDGTKVLRLWAKDASGVVSLTPSVLNVALDTLPPSVNISDLPAKIKGSSSRNVVFSASDANALTAKKLYFAPDGATYGLVADLTNSPYNWTVPAVDSTQGRLKIEATDIAGNTVAVTTSLFEIDSTAPSMGTFTLTSANPAKSSSTTLTLSSCTGVNYIFLGEGSAPSSTHPDWVICNTALTYTLAGTTQGARTIKLWGKDDVGNISGALTASVTLDTNAPSAPSVTRTSTSPTNSTSLTFSTANCTDTSHLLINTGSAPAAGDAGWVVCNTATTYSHTLATGDGLKSLSVWAKDQAGNVSVSAAALSAVLDQTPPTVNSVSIAGGAANIGTPFPMVAVNLSDPSAGTKVRLKQSNLATLDCQSEYADDLWENHTGGAGGSSQSYAVTLTLGDGTKKICAWAKDAVGNVSTISPSGGTLGVNTDDVAYQVGNIPLVTSLTVINNHAGSPRLGTREYALNEDMLVSFSVSDAEGLNSNPIRLYWINASNVETSIPLSSLNLPVGTLNYSGSVTIPAPSASLFKIKLVAVDSSENTSIASNSDAQNAGQWSIWAGSKDRGIGGTGNSASVYNGSNTKIFTVHPKTNDIYAIDSGIGVLKLSASTGLVTKFLGHGTTNLPNDGTLNSGSVINTGNARVQFDNDGLLYINLRTTGVNDWSGIIYQINLETNAVKKYAGGGSVTGATNDPFALALGGGHFDFDESNNLYAYAICQPGVLYTDSSYAYRLIKINRNPDKTAGAVEVVVGDCTYGNPIPAGTGPVDPTAVPMGRFQYVGYHSFTVWDNGNKIIYNDPYFNYKVLNGQLYKSNLTTTLACNGLHYNKVDNYLYYVKTDCSLARSTVNVTGGNGEVSTDLVSSTGLSSAGLNCTDDGILGSSACVKIASNLSISTSGQVFFPDGPVLNGPKEYRVRYLDNEGKVRTILGTKVFYGEGLDKSMTRASIESIYYKRAGTGDPANTNWPDGLYFVESQGPSFNYISPDGVVHRIWGDLSNRSGTTPDGTVIGPYSAMGAAYMGGDGKAMTFDSNGLPIVRYSNRLARINNNMQIQNITGGSTNWNLAADNTLLSSINIYPYGARTNISPYGSSGLFLMGSVQTIDPLNPPPPVASFLNTSGGTITKIMGAAGVGVSADNATAGSAVNLTLSANCRGQGTCFSEYVAAQDRLYFSEDTKLRYITTPANSATSQLGTLFTGPGSIANFIFSLDLKQVFYVTGGKLYCHDISSGKAWCNDTNLGPPTGLNTISATANQLTWKDSSTLLMSNGQGQIYSYTLLP